MKVFLTGIVSFVLGALAMAYMAQYTSQIFGHEQVIRAREGIVRLVIENYRAGDLDSAAALATGVNLLENYRYREWPLLSPVTGTFYRLSKPTEDARRDPKYYADIAAYLYSKGGHEEVAGPYYRLVIGSGGLKKEQVDARAKSILDAISVDDPVELKNRLRDEY